MARGDDQSEEARRILDRVSKESEPGGPSYVGRSAARLRGHLSASDAEQDDPIEVWGTRIGRVLGLVLFIGLVVYLLSMILGGG